MLSLVSTLKCWKFVLVPDKLLMCNVLSGITEVLAPDVMADEYDYALC